MVEDLHPILKNMIPLVEGIANTFGKNCEVVLHDVRNPDNSIVTIANGHVTNRVVGGPMSEYGLADLRKGSFDKNRVNYLKKTKDGRILKSTSMYIKDEQDKLIGFLCINLDISEFTVMRNIINEFTFINDDMNFVSAEGNGTEDTINDVLARIVDKVLESMGKPVAFLSKEEKVHIVQLLEGQGVFLVKGAIDYVAKVLCVSRYTIYNYLDEIRVEV
ncbi:MAG TPA: PAS domain-containing protein [Patescibacteria group bacterium]|nr:PAS domain-containing protein [Patescibacteria group bacterium]